MWRNGIVRVSCISLVLSCISCVFIQIFLSCIDLTGSASSVAHHLIDVFLLRMPESNHEIVLLIW